MSQKSHPSNLSVSLLLNVWAGDDHQLLDLSLSSIYEQTQIPLQIVVVVDGPIGAQLRATLEEKLSHAKSQVVLKYLPKNEGLSNARNIGISLCENNLIALHDADDVMHPDRLSIQTALFAITRPSVLGSSAVEFDSNTNRIIGQRKTQANRPLTIHDMWALNPIHHSSVLMSKEAISRVGMYQKCPGSEDLQLWRRLVRAGELVMNTSLILQALGTDNRLLERRRISSAMLRGEARLMLDQLTAEKWSETFTAPASFIARSLYRTLPCPLMKIAQNRFLRASSSQNGLSLNAFLCNPVPGGMVR